MEHTAEDCEFFNAWMDEIGGLITYLDTEIAALTEARARATLASDLLQRLEGSIEALEAVRDML